MHRIATSQCYQAVLTPGGSKVRILIGLLFSVIAFIACAHGGGFLETKGTGLPPSNLEKTVENQFERRAKCRDAALVQAQYEMLSILKGVHLEGGLTVNQAMLADSHIKATVDDVIRGAKVEGATWNADDSCTVTLRISKRRIRRMMSVDF